MSSCSLRTPFESKLQEDIEKVAHNLKKTKMEKYKRVLNDYRTGAVYSWSKEPRRNSQHNKKDRVRSVSFNLPSSSEDDFDHISDSSQSSNAERGFLDPRNQQSSRQPPKHAGRGGARGGRGAQSQQNRTWYTRQSARQDRTPL